MITWNDDTAADTTGHPCVGYPYVNCPYASVSQNEIAVVLMSFKVMGVFNLGDRIGCRICTGRKNLILNCSVSIAAGITAEITSTKRTTLVDIIINFRDQQTY